MRRKNRKSGFTLIELMVVLTVTAIVASAFVFAATSYIKWAEYKRENDNAKTIFTAFQMKLTQESESGGYTTLTERMEEYGTRLNLESIVNEDGSTADASDIYGEYHGTIYSIMGTAATYQEYISGEALEDGHYGIVTLYDFLDKYVYDKSILNAAICVEFDPTEGLVYAVLYSDRQNAFTYGVSKATAINICDRQKEYRYENKIGYYGVDTLAKSTSTKTEKPVIGNVYLNNEETLNLTYRLSRVGDALLKLNYEIVVYNAETDDAVMSITMNDDKFKIPGNTGNFNLVAENALTTTHTIEAKVTKFTRGAGGKTVAEEVGVFSFPAFVDDDGTVHFILDAVDLNATAELYKENESDIEDGRDNPFSDTFSFHRFGFDLNNIYCTIQGSGTNYKTTAKKQSNTSCVYYGEYEEGTAYDNRVCKIGNGRHLYNIRYIEGFLGEEYTDYIITASFDWGDMFKTKAVYCPEYGYWNPNTREDYVNSDIIATSKKEFTSIKELRLGSSFGSESPKRIYTIAGLNIDEERNVNDEVAGAGLGTGLFIVNYGEIKNIVLDNIQVFGENNVGAFCGTNFGNLNNLEVRNSNKSGKIVGAENVGGIVGIQGYIEPSSDMMIQFENLVNRSEIRGKKFVGGIVGQIQSYKAPTGKTVRVYVKDCKNYGKFSGIIDTAEPAYMGGITGFCNNDTGIADNLILNTCISSPQYSSSEIRSILATMADKTGSSKLTGVYVGGIVGFSRLARLQNCNTLGENDTEGYVIGGKYVGGIAGFNTGTAINGGTNNMNEANVLGRSFVGGIVGANASTSGEDSDGVITVSKDINTDLVLKNWVNKGVVVANSDYVGGITGYNTGIIEDCTCDVEYGSTAKTLTTVDGMTSSYAGGIAGYNNGIIRSSTDEVVEVVSVISGTNYVGGLVGFNDNCGELTKYEVQGGYINGDIFVGGLIGLNTTAHVLEANDTLSVNPNQVNGRYCVGGIIGGNIIDAQNNIVTEYKVDNFLGSITAKAFVGGFIGYNLLLTGENVNAVSDALIANLCDDDSINVSYLKSLSYTRTTRVMEIDGSHANMSMITGNVYVGGVIGYNDERSYLYIRNVTNYTPIRAIGKIKSYEYLGDTGHYYSFAGGVLGKISSHVIVENCQNANIGEVTTLGDYTGGISEVNCGLIYNCTAQSPGKATMDYIGGIVGINAPQNEAISFGMAGYVNDKFQSADFCKDNNSVYTGLYNCTLSGTVTGNSYVGGIVAENYGRIYDPRINGAIIGYGENIGGISGINHESGFILMKETANVSVLGNGENVGGIAGTNSGTIQIASGSNASKVTIEQGKSIVGNSNIGGVVGVQRAGNISGLVNLASISAHDGNAGGIFGTIEDSGTDFTVFSCVNRGNVQAAESGNAGGIVAENQENCTIRQSMNFGTISSANGLGGGITGINSGTIEDCGVMPYNASDSTWDEVVSWVSGLWDRIVGYVVGDNEMVMSGLSTVGGVSGKNTETGIISDCVVKNVAVTNYIKSKVGYIGGVTGVNDGYIKVADNAITGLKLKTYSDASNVGGIAGTNNNVITATGKVNIGSEEAKLTIAYANETPTYSNFGGVAGVNNRTVQNCMVFADITGNKGSDSYGYGGIAGVNNGNITACAYDGRLYSDGVTNALINTGGIAGINEKGAVIERSVVGREIDTSIINGSSNAAFGYLGGVVGTNSGSILSCDNATESVAEVSVIGYAGHVGGIVGFNKDSGILRGTADERLSTGENWIVAANYYSNDCGTGGIAGYSNSGYNMDYVTNHAGVINSSSADNTAVGGIIGRFENRNQQGFTMSYCRNYGNIFSTALSGGMVGRWKFQGGSIDSCENFGEIGVRPHGYNGSSNSTSSGGMVASFYGVTVNRIVEIKNSKNCGTIIAGTYGGGIVGIADSANFKLNVIDCVNTGNIGAKTNGNFSGIAARISNNISTRVVRCRNYGLRNYSSYGTFAGINAQGVGYIQDCFDYSNETNNPISVSKPSKFYDNYYVARLEIDAPDIPADENTYVDVANSGLSGNNGTVSDDSKKVNLFSKTFDGNDATRCSISYTNTAIKLNGSNKITINYAFSKPTDMDGFGIRWCNNGNASDTYRQYVYKMYYSSDNGVTWNVINSSDTYKNRETYNNSLQSYVEVGYPVAITDGIDNSIYYHAFDGSEVTNIKLEVSHVRTSAKLPSVNIPGVVWSDNTYNAYICIWDIYMVKDGETFDKDTSYCTEKPKDAPETDTGFSSLTANGNPVVCKTEDDKTYSLIDPSTGIFSKISGLSQKPTSILYYTDFSSYGDEGSYRYNMYSQVDPQISRYYKEKYKIVPNKPTTLKVSDSGGAYYISWSGDSGYGFSVKYYIDGELIDNIETVTNFASVDILDEWLGKNITIGVSAIYWSQSSGSYIENYTDEVTYTDTVKLMLEIPDVRIELQGTNNDSYSLVLVNKDSYEGYGDTVISFTFAGTIYKFKASEGELTGINVASDTNEIVSMQALPAENDDRHSASSARNVHTCVYAPSQLKSTKYVNVAYNGFYEKTLGGLYYSIGLNKNSDNVETYYNIELIAMDEDLGVPVAVSNGEAHMTNRGLAITTKMANLPENIFAPNAEVTARVYPWCTQGYISYFGHELINEASVSDVLALTENGSSIFEDDGQLKLGYAIQKMISGRYRVIFSEILADDEYAIQVGSKTYKVNEDAGAVNYSENNKGVIEQKTLPIQKKPVIDGYTCTSVDSGYDLYTFAWDTGKSGSDYSGAEYNVVLTGVTINGMQVEIANVDTSDNYIELEDNNWNYTDLTLRVERLGDITADKYARKLPSVSIEDISLKLRMATIERPTVELYTNEEGIRDKDSLFYNVIWNPVTNIEDLDYYEIMAFGKTSGVTATFCTNGDTVFRDSEMELIKSYHDDTLAESRTSSQIVVDFNDFNAGETIEISVRAIAKNDSRYYRSGATGVIRDMALPIRLSAPDLNRLNWSENEYLSVEEFNAGCITLYMGGTYADKGCYELSAEVYTSEDDEEPFAYLYDAEGNAISQDNPLSMTGSFSLAEYKFEGVSTDYAGKYIKVTMRAVSDSKISSIWTDSPASGVLAEKWIRLPKVQVESPLVKEDLNMHSYGKSDWEKLNQKTLSFGKVKYATEYSAQIIRNDVETLIDKNTDYILSYADFLYFKETENGYAVYYNTTYPGFEIGEEDEIYNGCKLIGEISEDGEEIELPYKMLVDNEIDFYASAYADVKDGEIVITLPDFEDSTYYGNDDATKCVTLRAVVGENENYVDSRISCWYRYVQNDRNYTAFDTVDDYPDAPPVTAEETVVSTREGYAYETRLISTYRLIATITIDIDNDGVPELSKVYAIPGVDRTEYMESLILMDEDYREFEGSTATVTYRAVVGNSGLSKAGSFEIIIP